MEHDTTPIEPDSDQGQPARRSRRWGLVAASLLVAIPTAGLATYSVAGADEAPGAVEVAEGGECSLTPEEIAELNADEDALAAFLDERGIRYTREAEFDGINAVMWDTEDEAANDAVEEFYAARYPLTPEEVAELTAEEDALAAFLDERGIRYTRETGPDGVTEVVWDENDDAAVDAVTEFWATRYSLAPEAEAETEAEVAVDGLDEEEVCMISEP